MFARKCVIDDKRNLNYLISNSDQKEKSIINVCKQFVIDYICKLNLNQAMRFQKMCYR